MAPGDVIAPLKRTCRGLLLPKTPRRGHGAQGPLVVAGMFKTANGLGQAATACVEALREGGLDPVAVDLSDVFNQADSTASVRVSDMPPDRSGTLILFANAPETERALFALRLRRWHDWRIIACWAWELTTTPASWRGAARRVSEIWAPSEFVAHSLRKAVAAPVRVAPHGIRPPRQHVKRRLGERRPGPLRCLTMADGRSSFHRKNLLGAVDIFKEAFADGAQAELTVKCRNLSEFPRFERRLRELADADRRIEIIDQSLPGESRWEMMSDKDVLLSAHRSEGFGLTLAEAMGLGLAVVATGWSGNLEFMTPQTSSLVSYTLEDVHDPFGIYNAPAGAKWAGIDISDGAAALRGHVAAPDRRFELGQRAAAHIRTRFDGRRYLTLLHDDLAVTA